METNKVMLETYGQNFTLEQIRTLDAVARWGSVAKAAQELHKVHSAIVYSMKSLEELTGVVLFDRTGYRTKLTQDGERIWQESSKVLLAEENLRKMLSSLKTGWEPRLKIVYDGIIPFDFLLPGFRKLQNLRIPTKISYFSEYLSQVESRFRSESADLMLTVLPPEDLALEVQRLMNLKLLLVAEKRHPVATSSLKLRKQDLQEYTIVNVRGGDFRLQLATRDFDTASQFHVPDFLGKKSVLLEGLGYGWMPEYLIKKELASKKLQKIRWEGTSESTITIYLVTRGDSHLGRAGKMLTSEFRRIQPPF